MSPSRQDGDIIDKVTLAADHSNSPARLLKATNMISMVLIIFISVLAALTTVIACKWILSCLRTRLRHHQHTSDFVVFESEVSIDMVEEGLCMGMDPGDANERMSCETFLSMAAPEKEEFASEEQPVLFWERRGRTVERRDE